MRQKQRRKEKKRVRKNSTTTKRRKTRIVKMVDMELMMTIMVKMITTIRRRLARPKMALKLTKVKREIERGRKQ